MRTLTDSEIMDISSGTSATYMHVVLQSAFAGTLSGVGTALATQPPSWKQPVLAGLLSGAFSGVGGPLYDVASQKINELIEKCSE